jgi:hypothetical protein
MEYSTRSHLLRLTRPQECTSNKAVPDPAKVGAYDLAALLAFRELEERRGKAVFLVDDGIVLLQVKGCILEAMNNFYSRSTHQACEGGICIRVGNLTLFDLENNEMARR